MNVHPIALTALLSLLLVPTSLVSNASARGPACSEPGEASVNDDDPFEPFNRAMFSVNDTLDGYILEPTARGWDFVVPHPVQRSISNFFDNLLFPIRFINNLLQGDIDPAAITVTRFAVNTTIGLGGVFDPATALDMPIQRADFGQTLGKWGSPPGPYLVWPIWGSSNIRDTTGLLVDAYFGVQTFFIDLPILIGSTAINALNARSLNLETAQGARDASFDLYVAARNAYQQQRLEHIKGIEAARAERDADLYFFEEDDFEDVAVPLDEKDAP
ncbi:MAG: VacJ family lipoprotein [Candidatus Binatia bacterium]|nr:VacJ family lipoprotein [Candidatus Binatia bacterium]